MVVYRRVMQLWQTGIHFSFPYVKTFHSQLNWTIFHLAVIKN
jgi:hypothetical protein